MKNALVLFTLLAMIAAGAFTGCKKDGQDKGGKKPAAPAAPKPEKIEYGTLGQDLCKIESVKEITGEMIEFQVALQNNEESLKFMGLDKMVDFAKDMALGMLETMPDPEPCIIKQLKSDCDELAKTVLEERSNLKLEEVQAKIKELGIEECGRIDLTTEYFGQEMTNNYFTGKVGGEWKLVYSKAPEIPEKEETGDSEETPDAGK